MLKIGEYDFLGDRFVFFHVVILFYKSFFFFLFSSSLAGHFELLSIFLLKNLIRLLF